MGSVHKSKNSRFWHGSFWHNGKQVYRSTGKLNKAEALQVVLAWEEAVKGPVESVEQARRVMADLLSRVVGDTNVRISCREYVKRWLESQAGTVSPDTQAFYSSTLQSWLAWLGPRAERPLDLITREDVVAFRTDESKRVTPATANHRLKALRQLFKAALADGGLTVNPADGVRSLRKERKALKVRRPFTPEELRQLTAVMDEEWQLITWVGLYTGQRLGDVLSLRRAEIDDAKNAVNIVTGKVGLRLWIPVPESLTQRLLEWWKKNGESEFVFQRWAESMASRKAGRTGKASDRFAHWLFLAGLRSRSPFVAGPKSGRRRKSEDGGQRSEAGGQRSDRREQHALSFHSLRHTARTLLEEAGEPKAVIDAFIGHDGDTGRIYTTVGEAALRKTAEALAMALGAQPLH